MSQAKYTRDLVFEEQIKAVVANSLKRAFHKLGGNDSENLTLSRDEFRTIHDLLRGAKSSLDIFKQSMNHTAFESARQDIRNASSLVAKIRARAGYRFP